MITLYGIPNCDTVKKARRWLDDHGLKHRFHDLRADPVDSQRLQHWLATAGAETLMNRRSTTWKQLPESQRPSPDDAAAVLGCLQQHPTLIKRPVLEQGDHLLVGFSDTTYTTLLNH